MDKLKKIIRREVKKVIDGIRSGTPLEKAIFYKRQAEDENNPKLKKLMISASQMYQKAGNKIKKWEKAQDDYDAAVNKYEQVGAKMWLKADEIEKKIKNFYN